MTCKWCEEDNELIKYCNIEDHCVCKICYQKYRKKYPLRVEGCPYCKGLQEMTIVYVRPIIRDRLHQIPYEVVVTLICSSVLCFLIIISTWGLLLKTVF